MFSWLYWTAGCSAWTNLVYTETSVACPVCNLLLGEQHYGVAITHNDREGLWVSVSRSSISYLPTSDVLRWEMDCPCVVSLEMENKEPFSKARLRENFKAFLQSLALDPFFCHLKFVFCGQIPCLCWVWRCFTAEAAAFCLLLWASELSSGFQLTVLGAELLTLSSLSLPLPLLLSFPLCL